MPRSYIESLFVCQCQGEHQGYHYSRKNLLQDLRSYRGWENPSPTQEQDTNSADKCLHWRMYKLWVLKGSLNIYIRKSYCEFPEFKERKALNYSPICDSLSLITHYFAIWRICISVYMFTFICFCINQFTSSLTLGAWFCACAIPLQLKDRNVMPKWDVEGRFYLVKASCPFAHHASCVLTSAPTSDDDHGDVRNVTWVIRIWSFSNSRTRPTFAPLACYQLVF